jgi:hypothetical protein
MTRTEVYREVLRLDEELKTARARLKAAQMRARVTGAKLPGREYASMWDHIHHLERTVETNPAVFALIADRAGLEA